MLPFQPSGDSSVRDIQATDFEFVPNVVTVREQDRKGVAGE